MKHVMIIPLLLFLAGSIYVFCQGWQLLPQNIFIKLLYSVAFVSLWAAYPVAMIGKETLSLPLIKWLTVFGGVFMVVLMYLILILLAIDLVRLFNHFFSFFPGGITRDVLLTRRITAGVIFGFLVVLLSIGHYRFSHPVVERLDLKVNKKANGRKELHVVAVSDIHLGFTIGKERLKKYVEQINALQPDVIVLSGDLIDVSVRPLEEYKMYEELQQLRAPLGVYMVSGNHEYISGIEASRHFIGKTGIRLLNNECVLPDSTFVIAGQEDLSSPDYKTLSQIVKGVPADLPIIALCHQPYGVNIEAAVDEKIDFLFCGHTHQGQVWPGNLIVKNLFEIPYGYAKKGETHIFVSSGLGLWGPQFRIGTQSEVVSVKMQFE